MSPRLPNPAESSEHSRTQEAAAARWLTGLQRYCSQTGRRKWGNAPQCANATCQVLDSEVHMCLPRNFVNVGKKRPLKVSPCACKCWKNFSRSFDLDLPKCIHAPSKELIQVLLKLPIKETHDLRSVWGQLFLESIFPNMLSSLLQLRLTGFHLLVIFSGSIWHT